MIEPHQPRHRRADPQDLRIRRSWWLLVGSFLVLSTVITARLLADGWTTIDLALVGLVLIVGIAALRHRDAVRALEAGRRTEAESFARILQGLSRSISPDSIVEAMVEELTAGTGADHVVVVRRRPGRRALEATLVSSRPGVPSSSTLLPLSDLEDPVADETVEREPVAIPVAASVEAVVTVGAPGAAPSAESPALAFARDLAAGAVGRLGVAVRRLGGIEEAADDGGRFGRLGVPARRGTGGRVAERIAKRVRDVYGLKHTIAAPLWTDEGLVGAIVLSRRTASPWPPAARRILAGASVEASAALARVYSHHDAEARASTDALTGLPNRRYFDEFCGLLARRRRAGDAVGVLMIDIDHFKQVNDRFGHAVGDEVLRAVGGAIGSALREDDVPARYGGEEFVVLLRNPAPGVAVEVGERIRAAVGDLDLYRFGISAVSVSIGVAVASVPDQPIRDVIAEADRALYEAKRQGRDRVVAAA